MSVYTGDETKWYSHAGPVLLDVHADEVDPDAVGGGARPGVQFNRLNELWAQIWAVGKAQEDRHAPHG